MLTPAVHSYSNPAAEGGSEKSGGNASKHQLKSPSNAATRHCSAPSAVSDEFLFCQQEQTVLIVPLLFSQQVAAARGNATRAVITWRTSQSSLYSPC